MKKLYVILFSLLYGPISCAQAVTYHWVNTENKIKIWVSSKNYTSSAVSFRWEGPTVENLAHGLGTLIIQKGNQSTRRAAQAFYGAIDDKGIKNNPQNGAQYIGPMTNRQPQGFGVKIQKNNNVFIGNFKDGNPHGNVTILKHNKLYYKGQYENNAFNGAGIKYEGDIQQLCIWKDGVAQQCKGTKQLSNGKYTGFFVGNSREGKGKMEYTDGSAYEGLWKENQWNGKGIYTDPAGNTLDGEWEEGLANGDGTYYTDLFTYAGLWKNNQANDFGIIEYADGTKYVGNWENGKQNGYGDIVFPDGDAYFGYWKEGKKQGNGRYLFSDGSYYMGEMKDDLPNGLGEFDTPNFHYIGEVKDGQPSGKGTVNFSNGDVYVGNLLDGEKEGLGHYTFAKTGNYYEGTFVNDKFDGLGIFNFMDAEGKNVGEYQGVFADGLPFGEGQFAFSENGENVQMLIKGTWNGFKLPKDVTIKFANGDIYKGKIINGSLSPDGVWSHEENGILKTFSKNTALLYKEHEKTIEKVLPWIEGTLIVASTIPSPVSPFAYGALITVEGVHFTAKANSNIALEGLNKETIKETAIDGAFVALDMAIPPGVKEASKAAKTAVSSGRAVTKVTGKKVIKKVTQKTIQKGVKQTVAKTSEHVLIKSLRKLWPEGANYITQTFEKMSIFKKYQNVMSNQIKDILKKNPEIAAKIRKGITSTKQASKILKQNWDELVGKQLGKTLDQLGAAAHHICPATDPRGDICRKMLKKCEIDINHPYNAAILPKNAASLLVGTIHQGSHFQPYFNEVTNEINPSVYKKHGCAGILKGLDKIRSQLLNGTLKLNRKSQANTILQGTRAI